MTKKKIIIYVLVTFISLLAIFGIFKLYQYIRIKTAKIEIVLKDDLTLEFNTEKKVSDFIQSMNGKIVDDYIIDSKKLGNKDVTFTFINDDHIKLNYTYQIEVVDTVVPLIWLGSTYRVQKDSDIDLTQKILCGDNYDNHPNCYIEGTYDIHTVGDYPLTFKAIDQSGNEESVEFTLKVYEPVKSVNTEPSEPVYTNFNSIVENYKNDKTKIGLDISSWQGDVDFEALKNAGVEFVMIRVGGTIGTNGEYFLDKKFKQNIENANKYGIQAGIYFYSYADSLEHARRDAKWVLKQIKKYKIDLPIAFDWEEWSNFNEYHLSFFGLTSMAEEFLKVIEEAGYQGMLYSSKTYLENMWMKTKYDIWLAHYTSNTTYQGDYKIWQICENGKVDGIDGAVDIDIMTN